MIEPERTIMLDLDNSKSETDQVFDIYNLTREHTALMNSSEQLRKSVTIKNIRFANHSGEIEVEHANVFLKLTEDEFKSMRSSIHQQSLMDFNINHISIEELIGKKIKIKAGQKFTIIIVFDNPAERALPLSENQKSKNTYITGDIKYTTHAEEVMRLGQHSQAPEFIEKLQALMLEYGVVKIDIAIDPYKFAPIPFSTLK